MQRCLSHSGERSQLLDSSGRLSAGQSFSQQRICVSWVLLDTERSWPYLQCDLFQPLLGRTVPSWPSFIYSPAICPRQFAWVRGRWFMEFFCTRLQLLLSSIIAILTFFPSYPYFHMLLSWVEQWGWSMFTSYPYRTMLPVFNNTWLPTANYLRDIYIPFHFLFVTTDHVSDWDWY